MEIELDENPQVAFAESHVLAKSLGTNESKLLKSIDDVDDFFSRFEIEIKNNDTFVGK